MQDVISDSNIERGAFMIKFKIIIIVIFVFCMSGCVIAGGFVDSLVLSGKGSFFQEAGERIDNKLFKEPESFAEKRARLRVCKYNPEDSENCGVKKN